MTNLTDQTHSSLRIIGLTGGIAMGKTLVSEYLATVHKLPIWDADIYAREAVLPNSSVLQGIVDRYGSGVLLPDRSLNRQRLGEIIFSSPAERLWVEQCIHPYVRDRFVQAVNKLSLNDSQQHSTVVMVVPLLFEARMTDLVTETWVVTCSEEQQIERLIIRDRLTLEQAQARINSQMEITKKKVQADIVLDNSSTPEALYRQVDYHIAQQARVSRQR